MSNTAAAGVLVALAIVLAVGLAAAWKLSPRLVPGIWQPAARGLVIWSLALVVPGLLVVAGIVGLSSRTVAEAVIVLDEPGSETYDRIALYLVGDNAAPPWAAGPDAEAHWLELEVLGLPWGDFEVRLDSRSLAPPEAQLTGDEADAFYPIDNATLPELLQHEAGLYLDETVRQELAAVAEAMDWLRTQRRLDEADEPDAGPWAERHAPALAGHFQEVRYAGPRIHDEPAGAGLATRPLIILAAIWALGVVGVALARRPVTSEVKD